MTSFKPRLPTTRPVFANYFAVGNDIYCHVAIMLEVYNSYNALLPQFFICKSELVKNETISGNILLYFACFDSKLMLTITASLKTERMELKVALTLSIGIRPISVEKAGSNIGGGIKIFESCDVWENVNTAKHVGFGTFFVYHKMQ